MFCTSKEQDTCRVEKMGCDGCFYNKEKVNYFVTMIHGDKDKSFGIEDQRCVGYFDTYEKAETSLINNACDVYECLYNYAVIEAIPSGIYQYDQDGKWFVYDELEEKYHRCQKPEFAKCMVGFAIG